MKATTFSVRDWIYVGVFGALWGAVELTLGTSLHLVFPPLADTFFTGVIMAGLGATIALVGRTFVPRTGAVLAIGAVTALIKALSSGGLVVPVMVAILAEAALMEVALLGMARPRRARYVLAGSLAVSWNFFHKFVMTRLIYGQGIDQVYAKMIRDGGRLLGIDLRYAVLIIVLLFLVRVVAGALAGWLAWELGRLVRHRLASA